MTVTITPAAILFPPASTMCVPALLTFQRTARIPPRGDDICARGDAVSARQTYCTAPTSARDPISLASSSPGLHRLVFVLAFACTFPSPRKEIQITYRSRDNATCKRGVWEWNWLPLNLNHISSITCYFSFSFSSKLTVCKIPSSPSLIGLKSLLEIPAQWGWISILPS